MLTNENPPVAKVKGATSSLDISTVLVHSCHPTVGQQDKPASMLESNINYIVAPAKVNSTEPWYHVLPAKCKCRKRISFYEADEFLECGVAQPIVRYTNSGIIDTLRDHKLNRGTYGATAMVWMPVVKAQTPRVDLISAPDMERAFCCDCECKCECPRRAPDKGRIHTQACLSARRTHFRRVHSEKCTGRKFKSYIEEVHQIYLEGRAELIVPERPDPFAGRALFILFGQAKSPSVGRTISAAEWASIKSRLLNPTEEV